MGYNAKPERAWDQPHHQDRSFVLAAKRDLLLVTARQYAHGTCTQAELEEVAVEFADALEKKALESLGRK